MPHPAPVEQSANIAATVGTVLDDAVANYVVNGGRQPTFQSLMAILRPAAERAMIAAFDEIGPYSPAALERAVAILLASLEQTVRASVRDAVTTRKAVVADQRSLSEQAIDAAKGGLMTGSIGAAVAGLAARLNGRPANRADLRRITTTRRLPRLSAGRLRQQVRTIVAVERNEHAARVVESRTTAPAGGARPGEWAIFVEDARFGPTDEPCEDVDGRWATPRWLRRHPVEHPNCTRRGRPAVLPQGATVTLIE